MDEITIKLSMEDAVTVLMQMERKRDSLAELLNSSIERYRVKPQRIVYRLASFNRIIDIIDQSIENR